VPLETSPPAEPRPTSRPEPGPERGSPEGPGARLRLDWLAGALASLLVTPAHAEPAAPPSDEPSVEALAARLNRWAPSPSDAAEYLPLAGRLLRHIAADVGAELPPELRGVYPPLFLATGWQESCWRQYVRRGSALVPLRSSAGAVGLMQVHERVWRGFYDVQGLRHDVTYNGRAGGEILRHYLRDHAFRREEQLHGGAPALARSAYAMYHGGPSHRARWRDPKTAPALRAIDAAFLEKFEALRAGNERAVLACFAG
jgi:soluble lytic murein transglycosylase-like protein